MVDVHVAMSFHSWLLSFCCFTVVLGKRMPYEFITERTNSYTLPTLPYDYKDLEPFIDETTVRVHHTGHHAAYTQKMNAAIQEWETEAKATESAVIFDLLHRLEDVPEKYRVSIQNNGGGYVNHNLYWSVMSPNPNSDEREPTGQIGIDIDENFGNFSNFKELFTKEALSLFGSGYVWLSRDVIKNGKLVISKTANQDSPLQDGFLPILVIDIWEHAYYIKHQNRRPQHVSDWWKLVDWFAVDELDKWWKKQNINFHDEL